MRYQTHKDMCSDKYIRTDTEEEATASFELAKKFLIFAQNDNRYWKWFILALHSGIQNCLSLMLENGNGLLVQKPGVTKRMLEGLETGNYQHEQHMDNFLRLFEKVKNKENLRFSHSTALSVTDEETEAIKWLDDFRDDFIHFNVKSWSIEKHLVICQSTIVARVASRLLNDCNSILWHSDENPNRIQSAISALEQQIQT
jgi:hypothetical protein